MAKKQIIILGAGFGGTYAAMHLEKLQKHYAEFEITLINRENYFVYQPMLAEVVGGAVGLLDTVSPLRRLIPKSQLYVREIGGIDLNNKQITLCPRFSHSPLVLNYDHLIIALGNVTDFRSSAGLHEHALPFKNLADAIRIRNHVIEVVEAASNEKNPDERKKMLTFVVGGGGFSGTEVVAEVNDFVRRIAKEYPTIDPNEIRVVLIHSKDLLMNRELSPSLGRYSAKILAKRGVELRFGLHLQSATPQEALLDNGERIPSYTIISTVPSSPNPLIESLDLPLEKGKIKTDSAMQVIGRDDVWAIGDCASIPLAKGDKLCPPTAQFAIREAKVLAKNIVNSMQNKPKKNFYYKAIGMLGALGHRRAVAEFFGKLKISGFFAWLMWRSIYWMKLPGFDRKIKTLFSWIIDMIIPIESVQLKVDLSQGIAHLHFESGEVIFYEGDVGEYLYIIVHGQVEICKEADGKTKTIANLGKGEFFGEKSLLNQRKRSATARCLESTDLLAIRKNDFGVLVANFEELRNKVEKIDADRNVE